LPLGIEPLNPFAIPLLNTLLLLSSGDCLKCNLSDFILINSMLPFYSPRVLSTKRIGPHNLDILSILIGSLLGDGTMEKFSSTLSFRNTNCKAIVVWGTNLGTIINKNKLNNQIKSMMKLPSFHKSVVVGLILSDGSLPPSKFNKNVPLIFGQSFNHFYYFWFVFLILAPYCMSFPYYWKHVRKRNIKSIYKIYYKKTSLFYRII
jgi:hypothetical protein